MAITPNTYPGSIVFINKLGLESSKELAAAETEFSLFQYGLYRSNPLPPVFDLTHLQAIHRQLFGDVYEWAGELRGYDIRKGICEFTPHQLIEWYAGQVYGELCQEGFLQGCSLREIIPRLAYYYDMTNRLHPFPEGNGRTQRLFIEHLAQTAGYLTDWGSVRSWQIVEVAEQSFKGNFDPTIAMFEDITRLMPDGSDWLLRQ